MSSLLPDYLQNLIITHKCKSTHSNQPQYIPKYLFRCPFGVSLLHKQSECSYKMALHMSFSDRVYLGQDLSQVHNVTLHFQLKFSSMWLHFNQYYQILGDLVVFHKKQTNINYTNHFGVFLVRIVLKF